MFVFSLRCCASSATIMAVHNVYVNTVSYFGNDKQKEEFLRPFSDGVNIGAFCLSEPGTDGIHVLIAAIRIRISVTI